MIELAPLAWAALGLAAAGLIAVAVIVYLVWLMHRALLSRRSRAADRPPPTFPTEVGE